MMHVIVRDNLHDADYLARHTVGFDRLKERLSEYPPERVAEITGIAADDVVKLGRAYATTRPAAIQVNIGMEKHRHGGMTYRTIACLPAIVGAWREKGGGLFHNTARLFNESINFTPIASMEAGWSTRSVNMVELGGALTTPRSLPRSMRCSSTTATRRRSRRIRTPSSKA